MNNTQVLSLSVCRLSLPFARRIKHFSSRRYSRITFAFQMILSANDEKQAMNLPSLPNDILHEIIDVITRDYWSVAAAADENKLCRTGRCFERSDILLGGEEHVQPTIYADRHKHSIPKNHMRNVKIARLNGVDDHLNYGINDRHWNPWLSSLAATCRQLRSRIMDDVVLQCLRIRGLKERELSSALEMFGGERLQVTRYVASF